MDEMNRSKEAQEGKEFNKEAWVAQKKKEREDAFALIDQTAERISTEGPLLRAYLDVQARFDRYSVSNALLITAQKPDARELAPYSQWKEQHVSIIKGEKGITILEPGKEYQKRDGSTGVSYNTKKLFDISQTTAENIEEPDVKMDYRLLIKALLHDIPCRVEKGEDMPENVNAFYDPDKKVITVRGGLSPQSIFRALAHERARAYMDMDHSNFHGSPAGREEENFLADCAAYIICARNNVPVTEIDLTDLPGAFPEKDARSVRRQLGLIRTAANDISRDMEKVLQKGPETREYRNEAR